MKHSSSSSLLVVALLLALPVAVHAGFWQDLFTKYLNPLYWIGTLVVNIVANQIDACGLLNNATKSFAACSCTYDVATGPNGFVPLGAQITADCDPTFNVTAKNICDSNNSTCGM